MNGSKAKALFLVEWKKAKIGTLRKLGEVTNVSPRDGSLLWKYVKYDRKQSALADQFGICNQRVSQIVAAGFRELKEYNRSIRGVDHAKEVRTCKGHNRAT